MANSVTSCHRRIQIYLCDYHRGTGYRWGNLCTVALYNVASAGWDDRPECDKSFPKFLVLGCGLLVVVQALANMAVAVNLVPVTGQPMPLVSRGGTSTLISCIYFGIILSVSRFGANIGNEDEEEEDTENPENPSDEPSGETINQAVEGEREDNPLSAVETITVESKV